MIGSSSLGSPQVVSAIHDAIGQGLPGARVTVSAGSPGHYSIAVVAEEFRGKSRVACQRLVYRAIAPLMQGDRAPVHAVDQLTTEVP
ncbi:MAG TPA: BolA/IbaG family iron-sulfur metabolism protein [Polyangiaceae bacterium]|nr:BolA/IbaG family iron-sulfur metabolism protein [Polyangiaceae bacterium]